MFPFTNAPRLPNIGLTSTRGSTGHERTEALLVGLGRLGDLHPCTSARSRDPSNGGRPAMVRQASRGPPASYTGSLPTEVSRCPTIPSPPWHPTSRPATPSSAGACCARPRRVRSHAALGTTAASRSGGHRPRLQRGPARRSSCRSGWAAWSPRRSPSCAARRRSWRATWRGRRRWASRSSSAAMPTWPTSASTPARSGGWSSTSTTSTRRTPAPGSGTSSGWRRASSWPRARTASPRRPARDDGALRRAHLSRRRIRRFAGMRALVVWYASIDVETAHREAEATRARRRYRGAIEISLDDAQRRDHIAALGKLSEPDPCRPAGSSAIGRRSCSACPTTIPAVPRSRRSTRATCARWRRIGASWSRSIACSTWRSRSSVSAASGRAATSRSSPARPADRSILQVKEARASVLEPYVKHVRHAAPGRARRHRAADHAGGLGQLPGLDEVARDGDRVLRPPAPRHEVQHRHRWRFGRPGMELYAEVCAWALARAHARSGQPGDHRRLPGAR